MRIGVVIIAVSIFCAYIPRNACAMASEHTEALKYLKNNNEWNSSISMQVTTTYSSSVHDNINVTDIMFIRDNYRCQWKGTSVLRTKENVIIEEASHVKFTIMDGERYLLAVGSDLNTLRRASIKQTDYKATQGLMLDSPDMGSALWGRIYGSNGMDIYELIEQSKNVRYGKSDFLADKLECYEIEGTCKYGSTKIVFSPERGYVPLKWEIAKRPGDYFDAKLLGSNIKDWKVTFCANEIKDIGGFHMPLKGRMQHDLVFRNGKISSDVYDYDVSNIQVSPGFEAINAFEFDLPSNVPVTLETAPGILYYFTNGKLAPKIDQDLLDVLDDAVPAIKSDLGEGRNVSTAKHTKVEKPTTDIGNSLEPQRHDMFSRKSVFVLLLLIALAIGAILYLLKTKLR
ncbi:MAG: hypothetical protein ACYS8Z_13770 [Planctomycetota bacterium]|jgi:hypothetical protein